jgi:tetratricopeptide (TPR) repeat protein
MSARPSPSRACWTRSILSHLNSPPAVDGKINARRIAWTIGLTLLAVLPYLPALRNGFVWDDQEFIVNNQTIRELFPLSRFFQKQGLVTTGDIYPTTGSRPLMTFSLALDYRLWKLDPAGYHLANLLLHLLCVWLVALVAYELTRRGTAAGLAAAIFSVLPGRAEAVIALLGRSDLLATLFILIGFYAYLKFAARPRSLVIWYLISAIGFLFAVLSKETGLVFIGLITGYELIVKPRRPMRVIILRLMPFLAIAAAYWRYRGWVLAGNTSGLEWWGGTMYNNYLMSLQAYAKYLWLIFVPAVLSPMHMVPIPAGPFSFLSLLGLVLGLVTVVLVAVLIRKDRTMGFGALWFLIAMLPVANILPIPGMIMAERWLYLPSVGLCLAAGLAAFRFLKSSPGSIKILARGFLFLILLIYSFRVFCWCPAWRSDETVARAALRTSPDSHIALNNLGKVLLEQGRVQEAEVLFRRSLEIKPNYGVAHLNLAMVLRDRGRMEEAKAECLKAVEFSPENPDAQNNLGVVLWRLGDTQTALEHIQEAIRLNPGSAVYRFNLGLALNQLGRIEAALSEFRTVVEIDSNNIDARLFIGYALGKLGRYQEAERELRGIINIKKNLPDAHYNLAGALEAQGRFAEAAEEYRIYLVCAPNAGNRSLVEEKIEKLHEHK